MNVTTDWASRQASSPASRSISAGRSQCSPPLALRSPPLATATDCSRPRARMNGIKLSSVKALYYCIYVKKQAPGNFQLFRVTPPGYGFTVCFDGWSFITRKAVHG